MSVNIIQGDDSEFKIQVTASGACYDLTNVTEATFKIPLEAGGCLDLTLTGGAIAIPTPANGELVVTVTDVQSPTLKIGRNNVELILDESGTIKTLQFKNGVTILERFC